MRTSTGVGKIAIEISDTLRMLPLQTNLSNDTIRILEYAAHARMATICFYTHCLIYMI